MDTPPNYAKEPTNAIPPMAGPQPGQTTKPAAATDAYPH